MTLQDVFLWFTVATYIPVSLALSTINLVGLLKPASIQKPHYLTFVLISLYHQKHAKHTKNVILSLMCVTGVLNAYYTSQASVGSFFQVVAITVVLCSLIDSLMILLTKRQQGQQSMLNLFSRSTYLELANAHDAMTPPSAELMEATLARLRERD